MSTSVTPSRRPREESGDEAEDFEVSVDGESPARSNRSKRARLDDEGSSDGDEEEEEEQDTPLLPDSFRRSPKGKGKGRAGNGTATPRTVKKHQPGSIVRVTLTDFVTYTKAEFNPGPNLNMVIGPNGTGKSTLVCAICIGLGWATKHLGRGKDLNEFVKHGAKRGQIEIELAADPERHDSNPVITTKIDKGDTGNASEYLINGKKANKKRVQELAQSFSIQVDNLCQFLPQDKVVEFAALSPVELLSSTQLAAAPQQMSDWHEQLKEWRKQQKTQQVDQQRLAEIIKSLEDRQRKQQPDVDRLRERSVLQERFTALDKMRPLPEFRAARQDHANAKQRRKEAEKELKELKRRMEPNMAAVKEKERYLEITQKGVRTRENLTKRNEELVNDKKKKLAEAAEKIQAHKNEFEAEVNSVKNVKQSLPGLRQNKSRIEKAMETPPEAFDPAAMNEEARRLTREIRSALEKRDAASHDVGSLNEQVRQRESIIREAEREKQNMQSQAGQQTSKLRSFSPDVAKAWEWIQANRARFEGEVYGPPLVECRVKDQKHAAAVESMVPQGDALAFTVTTKADFDMLTDQLNGMRLRGTSVRASITPLGSFRSPLSNEALTQYGLDGWVLDLMEGPDPVLAMLCDNRSIHTMAYALRDISSAQFEALKGSPLGAWVTPQQSFQINRRREYGPLATSTRAQDLKEARMFTDVPVDHQGERDIDRRVAETQSEIDELKESHRAKKFEHQALEDGVKRLQQEKKNLETEKNTKQSAVSQFNGLATKLERAEEKLQEAQQKLAGSTERKKAIIERADKIYLEKGQYALDYANAVEQLRQQHVLQFEAEIVQIEATSDLDQLRHQHAEEQRLINERDSEVKRLEKHEAELLKEGKRLQEICGQLHTILNDKEHELLTQVGDEEWTIDKLNTEIMSVEARLEGLAGGGNQNTLKEFDQRANDIETKTRKFNDLGSALATIEAQITDVREQWEPELDALVEEISEAFAENFAKIQCAGEVGVHKDEDFEHWAIQIKVKFRENEPLSLLDSHRQSGGERAVSTIFYLMALQSLARAPFRVVDEINQGMDPRNERLVHSRMVDIACAEVREGRQGSQYFLITPKLLQGLKYHEDMKVHCIASGEHMPGDFREVDFATAAKRALELRGRRAGVAAG